MRKTFFLLLVIFFYISEKEALAGIITYPDFYCSMLRVDVPSIDLKKEAHRRAVYHSSNPKYVTLFKDLYEENIKQLQNTPLEEEYRIPRIIHQIWIGGEVPEEFRPWMETWASLEGWEYKLWTDEDVKKLSLENRDLYEMATNLGEKADILRLEILSSYGGLYVDVDFECVNPAIFEELHKSFHFYIGFEPLEHGKVARFNMFKVCNALIASCPRHPLLKDLLLNMKANYFAYLPFRGVIEKTGPSYITRILCEYAEVSPGKYKNMYLPSTFFYPLTENELLSLSLYPKELPLPQEVAGIHYWSGSWLKTEKENLKKGYPQ